MMMWSDFVSVFESLTEPKTKRLIFNDVEDVDPRFSQVDALQVPVCLQMKQQLYYDVKEIIPIIDWRVNNIADEVELGCSRVAAQDPALCFVLCHLLDDILCAGFLDVSNSNVAAVECSRNIRKRMKLGVQVSAEEMKDDPSVARDVISLLALADRWTWFEFVVFQTASLC